MDELNIIFENYHNDIKNILNKLNLKLLNESNQNNRILICESFWKEIGRLSSIVKNKAIQTGDWVEKLAKDFVDITKKFFNKIKNIIISTKNWINGIPSKLKTTMENIGKEILDIVDDIKQDTKEIKKNILEIYSNLIGEILNEIIFPIKNTIKEIEKNVDVVLPKLISKEKDNILATIQLFQNSKNKQLKDICNEVKEFMFEQKNMNVKTKLKDLKSGTKVIYKNAKGLVKTAYFIKYLEPDVMSLQTKPLTEKFAIETDKVINIGGMEAKIQDISKFLFLAFISPLFIKLNESKQILVDFSNILVDKARKEIQYIVSEIKIGYIEQENKYKQKVKENMNYLKSFNNFINENKNTNLKHYLYSDELDTDILTMDILDKDKMKEAIIKHLEKYPDDTLTHMKDLNETDRKKYSGKEEINYYEINPKTGKASKIVTKGNKDYYKPLD